MSTHNQFLRLTKDNQFDKPAMEKALVARFPRIAKSVDGWLDTVIETVRDARATDEPTLFRLARHIKGGIKFEFRDMPAETLFPYALLYCEIVDYLGMGPAYKIVPGDLDADDQDEVEIMFEEAWDQVEFGTGENLLSVALASARAMTPKDFPEVTNTHSRTLLGICSYLQKSQGIGKPFLLPQDRIAEMLGRSQQAISATIHILMKKGYLKQVEEAVHLKAKAAKYTLHKPRKKR